MKYMLDTDTCIYIIKAKPFSVATKLSQIAIDDICISSITLAELQYGVDKSSKPKVNQVVLDSFLEHLWVAPFEEEAAWHYGKIRTDLESRGLPIGGNDYFIAAHCLSLKLTLVTNNGKEYRRIHRLNVENWAVHH